MDKMGSIDSQFVLGSVKQFHRPCPCPKASLSKTRAITRSTRDDDDDDDDDCGCDCDCDGSLCCRVWDATARIRCLQAIRARWRSCGGRERSQKRPIRDRCTTKVSSTFPACSRTRALNCSMPTHAAPCSDSV